MPLNEDLRMGNTMLRFERNELNYHELFDAAQRQAQDALLLERVRTALASEIEPGELIRRVVEEIVQSLGYTQVSVYLIENDVLQLQHQVGYDSVISTIPLHLGVTGRVARTGVTVYLPDVQSDPHFLGAIEGILSEICIPLFCRGYVVGVLNVESTQNVHLTEIDLHLIQAIGEHINLALARAQLYEELRTSKDRYRVLVENARDVIFRLTPQGAFASLNRAFVDNTGWSTADWLGKSFLPLVHPNDQALALEYFERALAGENPPLFELGVVLFNDYAGIIELTLTPLFENGRVVGVLGTARDVTQRKRSEEALRASEKRFRELIANLQVGILLQNAEGEILLFNQTALDLLGAEVLDFSSALRIKSAWRAIHEDGSVFPNEQLPFHQAVATRQPVLDVVMGITHGETQKRVWLLVNAVPELDASGQVHFIICSLTDISVRKQIEEALRQSRELFATAFQTSPAPIVINSLPDTRFLDVNSSFLERFGYSRQELLGRTPTEVNLWVNESERLHVGTRLLRGEKIHDVERILRARDGSPRNVLVSAELVYVQNLPCALTVLYDVTERKRAEDRRTMLYRATQEINASIDREQICAALHHAAAQVMPVDVVVISLLVEQGTLLEDVYLYDEGVRFPSERHPVDLGLTGYVVRTKAPLRCENLNDPEWERKTGAVDFGEFKDKRLAALAVPLQTAAQVIGMISVQAYGPHLYGDEDLELLQVLAAYGAIALENARLYEEIKHLSILDELTGVYNRRGFFELGNRELSRTVQSNTPLCAIMLDIDHFKQVNDTYGHSIGDRVLKRVTDVCRNTLRDQDIFGRYGGEEFAILVPETDSYRAAQIANRLRMMIYDSVMETPRGHFYVTVSFGVAQYHDGIEGLAALLDRADSALYRAKQEGRNCVRVAGRNVNA